jgi:DNA invertase Pin-like site-specific DNA recombinase
MRNQIYGYIRVSTQEQSADRQHIALLPFKIPKRNLFVDIQSGKNFDRPAYQRLIRRLDHGDLLVIASIDRLGRNYGEIIEQWRLITKIKGADIRVLDMPLLDTTYCKDLLGTFISDLVLQVLSFAAQLERDNMLQRQAAGIAAARSRGVVFGRKPLPLLPDFASVVSLWRNGELSADETAALCGFSRRTLYNRTKNMR